MSRKTTGLIDFDVEVKNGSAYQFVEDVIKYTLPSVEFGEFELKGGGIPGTLKVPDIFNLNELTFAVTTRSDGDGILQTFSPEGAEFRISESFGRTGVSSDEDTYYTVTHVIKGFAKTLPNGDREKGSVSEMETSYAVYYYKMSKNGKILHELDIMNNKIVFGDVDHTEKLKASR